MQDYKQLYIAGGTLSATPQDTRDYIFGSSNNNPQDSSFDFDVSSLPVSVDLRGLAGSIENQTRTSSCVGNAIASCAEIMLQSKNQFVDLSRLFVYYNAREAQSRMFNTPISDTGSNIRLAIAETTKLGICDESIWPFDELNVNTKPNINAYENAKNKLTFRYESLGLGDIEKNSHRFIREVKVALSIGYPVIFGMNITNNFFNVKNLDPNSYNEIAVKGSTNYAGGHALLIVGYDDTDKTFIIENSWGSSWGSNGYCKLYYNVVAKNSSEYGAFVLRNFNNISYEIPTNVITLNKQITNDNNSPEPIINITDKKENKKSNVITGVLFVAVLIIAAKLNNLF